MVRLLEKNDDVKSNVPTERKITITIYFFYRRNVPMEQGNLYVSKEICEWTKGMYEWN